MTDSPASEMRAAATRLTLPGAILRVHPTIAAPLTDWLKTAAEEAETIGTDPQALAVARAILGQPRETGQEAAGDPHDASVDSTDAPPGGNAEDCPRCAGTDLPYPWLCPGHDTSDAATELGTPPTSANQTGDPLGATAPPDEATILAARHLDATEGGARVSKTITPADRSAIDQVLRYIAKAHNSVDEPPGPAATQATEEPHCPCNGAHHPSDTNCRWCKCHRTTQDVWGPADDTTRRDPFDFSDAPVQPDAWTPPPPGDTSEQLPDHILNLIEPPDYLSTACQTADLVACAACYPGSGVPRPLYDEIREHAERLHERCRLNNKFTGALCTCGCH